MRFHLESVHAFVEGASPEERAWLRSYLSFPDKAARWTGREAHALYSEVSASFAAGLAPLVAKAAAKEGFAVELVDERETLTSPDWSVDLAWLRPEDQLPAVRACIEKTRGIVRMGCGGGKTEILLGLVRVVRTHWLLLAPSIDLVRNAADRYDARLEFGARKAGRIGDGKWSEGDRLTCATFQALASALKKGDPRALDLLGRVGGVVGDEAHTAAAGTFLSVMMRCPAYYRIGLSATPLSREDDRSVLCIGALGPVIYTVSSAELVARGEVAHPVVRMVRFEQPDPGAASYEETYKRRIVHSRARNARALEIARAAPKPLLVFVRELIHGEKFRRLLEGAGMRAEFVEGKLSNAARAKLAGRLRAGDLDALVCTKVFGQGIDLPEVRTTINLDANASKIVTVQRLGRGARVVRAEGGEVLKDSFDAWDFLDVGEDALERHAFARKAAYEREGLDVEIIE